MNCQSCDLKNYDKNRKVVSISLDSAIIMSSAALLSPTVIASNPTGDHTQRLPGNSSFSDQWCFGFIDNGFSQSIFVEKKCLSRSEYQQNYTTLYNGTTTKYLGKLHLRM
jgi:hypothetical protein